MKISVVTVVKDSQKYISRAIDSVLKQNFQGELEYIIYDCNSTDGTSEIIINYSEKDSRIKYYREKDDGPSDALRKAFDKATGDIYCWINADDYYLKDVFSLMLDEIEDFDFIYGDYYTKDKDVLTIKKKISFNRDILFYRYMMMPQPSSFWRSNIYHEAGGIDRDFKFAFDYDLFLRMAHLKKFKAKYIPTPLSVFEIHENQITAKGDKHFRKERYIARRKIRNEHILIYKLRKYVSSSGLYIRYLIRLLR